MSRTSRRNGAFKVALCACLLLVGMSEVSEARRRVEASKAAVAETTPSVSSVTLHPWGTDPVLSTEQKAVIKPTAVQPSASKTTRPKKKRPSERVKPTSVATSTPTQTTHSGSWLRPLGLLQRPTTHTLTSTVTAFYPNPTYTPTARTHVTYTHTVHSTFTSYALVPTISTKTNVIVTVSYSTIVVPVFSTTTIVFPRTVIV